MLRLLRNLGGATGIGRKDQDGEDMQLGSSSTGQYMGLSQVISLDAARPHAPRPGPLMVATINGRSQKPASGQATPGVQEDETEVSDFEDDGDEYDGGAPSPQKSFGLVSPQKSVGSPQRTGANAAAAAAAAAARQQQLQQQGYAVGRASPSVGGLRTASCIVPRTQPAYSLLDRAGGAGEAGDGGVDGVDQRARFHTLLDPAADIASSQYSSSRHAASRFDVSANAAMSMLQEGHRLDFELYSAEAAVKQAHASGSFTTASPRAPGRPHGNPSASTPPHLHLRRRSETTGSSGALRPTLSSQPTGPGGGGPGPVPAALQVTSRTASALGGRPPPALLLSCPGAAASIGAQLTWEPPPVSALSPGAAAAAGGSGRARRTSSLTPATSMPPTPTASAPGAAPGGAEGPAGSVSTPGLARQGSADHLALLQQLPTSPGGEGAVLAARSSTLGPGTLVSVLQQTQPGMVAVKAGVRVGGRSGTSGPSLLDVQSMRHASASAMFSPLAAPSGQLPSAFGAASPSDRTPRAPPQHPLAGYLSSVLSPEELRQLDGPEAPADDTQEVVEAPVAAKVITATDVTPPAGGSPSSSAAPSPGPSLSGVPSQLDLAATLSPASSAALPSPPGSGAGAEGRPRRRLREPPSGVAAAGGSGKDAPGAAAAAAAAGEGQAGSAAGRQPQPKRFIVGRVTNGLDYLALDRNPKYRNSGAGGA